MSRQLDDDELQRQLTNLPGWHGSTDHLMCSYRFGSYLDGVAAVPRVAVEAEEMNHHPDIDIRWRQVNFTLSTHDAGGVTQLDIELAHRIRLIAEELNGQTDQGTID